jgi:hypothetical protein
MSAPQYFRLANCNRTIKSNGLYFQFDACYCSGGRWIGVFATADEKQIAAASKIPGVEIVSQEAYLDTLKKKPAGQPTMNPLLDTPDGKSPLAQQDARLVGPYLDVGFDALVGMVAVDKHGFSVASGICTAARVHLEHDDFQVGTELCKLNVGAEKRLVGPLEQAKLIVDDLEQSTVRKM